jgi:hypothetical protein
MSRQEQEPRITIELGAPRPGSKHIKISAIGRGAVAALVALAALIVVLALLR